MRSRRLTLAVLVLLALVALGQAAEAFLGTQGDVWDTQSDMFFALIGGLTALGLFSRLHERQMERLRWT